MNKILCRLALFVSLCPMGCAKRETDPAADLLIDQLNKGDFLVKLKALQGLRNLGEKARPAIPLLIQMIEDENPTIPGASAAVDVGTISSVGDASSCIRCSAAATLGTIGPEARSAIPTLIGKLKDRDRFLRSASAKALAGIGVKEDRIVSAIKETLGEPDAYIRIAMAEALADLEPGSKVAISTVTNVLLNDKDAGNRFSAALSLTRTKSSWIQLAIPALITALIDPDGSVREQAAYALGEHCEEAAIVVPALIDRLNVDKQSTVRQYAAQALGEFGPEAKQAIPSLTRAVKDTDPDVRILAAQSLEHVNSWLKKRGRRGREEQAEKAKAEITKRRERRVNNVH